MSRTPTAVGTVGILNVGDGDTKLSFDKNNPAERIRAARIVADMLRRGYALLIEVDGKFVRATEFKEDVCEYIIADFDPITAVEHGTQEDNHAKDQEPHGEAKAGTTAEKKRGPKKQRSVDAGSARAVAVAPISGG